MSEHHRAGAELALRAALRRKRRGQFNSKPKLFSSPVRRHVKVTLPKIGGERRE